MKKIEVVKAVTFIIPVDNGSGVEEQQKTLTFADFMKACLETHTPFNSGLSAARQFDKLMTVAETLDGHKSFRLDDADYDVFCEAMQGAKWVNPRINRACLPFYEAVEKATEVASVEGEKG
jgi:hypothetical protein